MQAKRQIYDEIEVISTIVELAQSPLGECVVLFKFMTAEGHPLLRSCQIGIARRLVNEIPGWLVDLVDAINRLPHDRVGQWRESSEATHVARMDGLRPKFTSTDIEQISLSEPDITDVLGYGLVTPRLRVTTDGVKPDDFLLTRVVALDLVRGIALALKSAP